MITTERLAEKIECVADELRDYAKELRRGEGDWRWQAATLRAQEAIRSQLTIDEGVEPREPTTFAEARARYEEIAPGISILVA